MPVVGLLTHNDCDVLRAKIGLYRWVTPRTIILPTLAPQVPRCTGSSIQPGSKCHRDDLGSLPKQSKELTLRPRLGPPVDIRASWPSQGGSLISWMTEHATPMSRSSTRPGTDLLLLLPPRSHI